MLLERGVDGGLELIGFPSPRQVCSPLRLARFAICGVDGWAAAAAAETRLNMICRSYQRKGYTGRGRIQGQSLVPKLARFSKFKVQGLTRMGIETAK